MHKYQAMSPEFVVAMETLAMSMYAFEKRSKDPVWSLATSTTRDDYRLKAASMVAEGMKMV
jgi:hypothetical protein